MPLDIATFLTVATCVTGLLGVFILAVWVQDRASRALAWWGAAYLMGGSAVSLWGAQSLPPIAATLASVLLFVACGLIWNGARLFQGRVVLPGALFAGAVAWLLAGQFSAFTASSQARVVLSSLIVASYAFLTAFELGRDRRRNRPAVLSGFAPFVHGTIFLLPIPLTLLMPAGTAPDGWFALVAIETLLYVVGTAFLVVTMTQERIALGHKTAAMTDPLTGLFNRRAFFEVGQQLMARQARSRAPVSVLAFDLDHFKSINDRFGHAVGDDALRLFAATARNNVRTTDVLGRLGGEEFVALLPGGPAEAAMVAERLRAAFQAAAVEISSHRMNATVSIGVAAAIAPVDINQLLERADEALYQAKSNGRNRVEIAAGEPVSEQGAVPDARPVGFFRAAIACWNPVKI